MAFDYSELVATADELIREFGRQATISIRTDIIPDPTQPWKATGATSVDTVVWTVEIPFSVDRPEGTHRSRDDKRFLVAGAAIAEIPLDAILTIDGEKWSVQNPIVVRPGSDLILHDVLVRKWPPRSNS